LARVRDEALVGIREARTVAELDGVRRQVVGRAATLLEVRRAIGSLPAKDRKLIGAAFGRAQQQVQDALAGRELELLDREPALAAPLDVTLPAPVVGVGALHPTVQLMYDLNDAFAALNFEVYEGPEISSERFEFDHLNFPPGHPARESMDTFWLEGSEGEVGTERLCLRPHLTGASVRYMTGHTPPFRLVYPGRVYRNESTDARHERVAGGATV
jgi:phenylalanyl-tRNA synthetase alpha chain